MLVLGVDPGTAATGYGLVRIGERNQYQLVECGVIRTAPRDPLPARLLEIYSGIGEVIQRHRPHAVAIENVFVARNVRTTLTLGHARGVVMLAAQQANLPVHEFPPAEIKKAIVGAGSATKDQVQFMVAKLLRLAKPPTPADAADGVAAALTLLTRLPVLARAATLKPNAARPR